MKCKYKMVEFSSLGVCFRLIKCKLRNRTPTVLVLTLSTTVIGKIGVQLQLSLFSCFHREEIWMRDGKWKINLGTVTFHLPRTSKYILKALDP